MTLRYWGGPYCGDAVKADGTCKGTPSGGLVRCLPLRPALDPAGRAVVHPLGAHERYEFVADPVCRYEWRGTHRPQVSA